MEQSPGSSFLLNLIFTFSCYSTVFSRFLRHKPLLLTLPSLAPLHALFTALRVSRASFAPVSRPSLLPSTLSSSLRWEICRIVSRDDGIALSDYFSIIRNLLADRIGPLPEDKEEVGESIHEFYLCVSSPLEMKVRWSDRLRSFLLSVRGLVQTLEGGEGREREGERRGGRVNGWTESGGEMVLMNWQKPENIFSVVLDTFGKQENGVSQKKMRACMRGQQTSPLLFSFLNHYFSTYVTFRRFFVIQPQRKYCRNNWKTSKNATFHFLTYFGNTLWRSGNNNY